MTKKQTIPISVAILILVSLLFFILFKRYWNDCDLPFYLLSNENLSKFDKYYPLHKIELEKEYGQININLVDGSYTEVEKETKELEVVE